MERDDEDRVVAAEHRIGAVAVVDVPVDDRHALDSQAVLRMTRGDGDVAEQAEPHCVTP